MRQFVWQTARRTPVPSRVRRSSPFFELKPGNFEQKRNFRRDSKRLVWNREMRSEILVFHSGLLTPFRGKMSANYLNLKMKTISANLSKWQLKRQHFGQVVTPWPYSNSKNWHPWFEKSSGLFWEKRTFDSVRSLNFEFLLYNKVQRYNVGKPFKCANFEKSKKLSKIGQKYEFLS